jgi:hypothetical protein
MEQQEDIIIIDNNQEYNIIIENNGDDHHRMQDIIINDLEDNDKENNIIEEGEENDSDEEDEEQITEQEALIRYALTLDTKGTAAVNNRPARNGEGNVEMRSKKQLDTHTRMLIVVYAVCFMDYKNPLHSKVERKRIWEAACNLVCYDLGYKKI